MATLERLLTEVGRAFGPKRIWLTEYGYQTGPPDGVDASSARRELIAEAALRAYQAPRVDMLIHYLVSDEPASARCQSGLYTVSGPPKPRRARSRCRSRRPAQRRQARPLGPGAPADGRADLPRPGAPRRRVELGAAARAGRTRAASSASPSPRRRARRVRVSSPQDGAYSAAIRAR